MKIERSWLTGKRDSKGDPGLEDWKEITEDRANRELANAHGNNAIEKLKEEKELKTRFGHYRIVE